MEREVFPSPAVRAAAQEFVPLKINVDRRLYGDICRTWRPEGGVPGFVVLGADGSILEEWVGALEPQAFAVRLLRGKHKSKVPEPYRDRWDRAARRLMDGDVEPLRELIAALHHAGETEWAKRLSLMECREHYYRYRWSLCVEAAELTLRRYPGTEEAARLRARARFRAGDGIEPATRERVDELIRILGEAWPRFGSEERQQRWVREQNAAADELVAIGEPAVDQLMECLLEGDADASVDCARAIGRIRDSRVLPDLITHLEDKSMRNPVRARVAMAMEPWCDPAFLPVLVEHLGDPGEPDNVRIACADAVRRLGASHGGLYGPKVVEPLFRALSDRNPDLRFACLQAIREVRDNFDLARLFPYMDDHREGPLWSIAAEACDVFCARAGHRLLRPDGEPVGTDVPKGTRLFLESWWQANASKLAWDPDEIRYVPRSR